MNNKISHGTKMNSYASSGRVSISRHQLRRDPKGLQSHTSHQHQSVKPKSALCTSFQNMQHSSATSIRRSSTNLASSSSILVVKTQNDSLRSSYGSSDYLHARNSFTSNNSVGGDSMTSSGSMSNVSFNKVCVREYPRCIGDNVPSEGPPISIDWKHQTHEEMSIDEYERARPLDRKRSGDNLRIKSSDRVAMLENEWQASHSDVMRASLESTSVRERRIKTIQRARNAERVEEIMESARHSLKKVSLKRVFSGSKKEKSSRNVKFRGF